MKKSELLSKIQLKRLWFHRFFMKIRTYSKAHISTTVFVEQPMAMLAQQLGMLNIEACYQMLENGALNIL